MAAHLGTMNAARPSSSSSSLFRVGVIGAGPSGLAAARILAVSHGFTNLTVFERSNEIGGQWQWDADANSQLSSMYEQLYTNLPHSVMQYMDHPINEHTTRTRNSNVVPSTSASLSSSSSCSSSSCSSITVKSSTASNFVSTSPSNSTSSSSSSAFPLYPSREMIYNYLLDYCSHYDLRRFIQFGTEVISVDGQSAASQPSAPSSSAPDASTAAVKGKRFKLKWRRKRQQGKQQESGDTANSTNQMASDAFEEREEEFDAIVVASGHFVDPAFPVITGLRLPPPKLPPDLFTSPPPPATSFLPSASTPASTSSTSSSTLPTSSSPSSSYPLVLHSHSYRFASSPLFHSRHILIIGASHSGVDIAGELSTTAAATVYLSRKQTEEHRVTAEGMRERIDAAGKGAEWRKVSEVPQVERIEEDGRIVFRTPPHASIPSPLYVDVIICATGFYYTFPYLSSALTSTHHPKRITPLYHHLFDPRFPFASLSYLTLPFLSVPFPLAEVQCEWLARIWEGKAKWLSEEEMRAREREEWEWFRTAGGREEMWHRINMIQHVQRMVTEMGVNEDDTSPYGIRIDADRRIRRYWKAQTLSGDSSDR